MNVTANVRRNCVFSPTPIRQGARIELESSAWRWKSPFEHTINTDTGETSTFRIRSWSGQWHDVWRTGFWRLCINAVELINSRVLYLIRRNCLFIHHSDFPGNLERTIATHKPKWRQIFCCGLFG